MHRLVVPCLIAGCLAALFVACYGPVLFHGRQFGFRDAAQYYYPLYWRVQAEWRAGRVPLWEPGENAGMPLLGNPTAAVLYPGKIVYALLPYAWAARLYIVLHSALAVAAMGALMRTWGASPTAAALAALAYAFGAPVLFQSSNVVYLVGAAWAPLGFRAADRWLRCGRRWGLIELALVLAMTALGGDPESAYVLVVCAGGYGLGLAWSKESGRRSWPRGGPGVLVVVLIAAVLAVAWVAGTLELARRLPMLRPPRPRGLPSPALPWMRWVSSAVLVGWGTVGLALLARWWRRGREPVLGTMLLGLAAAVVLAATLAAAQLLPVLEFTGQTTRASGESHDVYPFSLEPVRIVELAWPNVFGSRLSENRSWLGALRPERSNARVWVPSLYLGGLTLVLSAGAMGFRGGEPGRAWLTAVFLASLAASVGEYTGPLWWARWDPDVAARLGPHDPWGTPPIRMDGQLRDGDGSFYWLLTTVLPGFRQFRFPSKLLSLTALALAGLAGLGWDRLSAGAGAGRRRTCLLASGLLATGVLALAGVVLQHERIVAAFRASPAARSATASGPFDAEGTYGELRRALAHGSLVSAVALALAMAMAPRGARRPPLADGLALVLMTADLSLANARHVLTVPQALLDATPRAIAIIEAAERAAVRRGEHPTGPFRVHRMSNWSPPRWGREPGAGRIGEILAWERDTLQPKYGLLHGSQYTLTLGAAEIDDYEWFFEGSYRRIDAATAGWLGAKPGQAVVVYPRRSFDLWNSRYFIIPGDANGWSNATRGYASFVPDAERIYPPPDAFRGPRGAELERRWRVDEDFQVFRNLAAYPRAWVVHAARFHGPIDQLGRARRHALPQEISDSADPLRRETGRPANDPHIMAWVGVDAMSELGGFLPGMPPLPSESPAITRYGPQAIEIDVTMAHPGLLVLADLYYPGWRLTIDGTEAPIYRVNDLMRGAAVRAGKHHLVFIYAPRSFRVGVLLSMGGLAALAVLGVVFLYRPTSSGLAMGVPTPVQVNEDR